MSPEQYGYFTHRRVDVDDGLRYAYRLDAGEQRPDPASRWQPDGINRASAVFSPGDFVWTDDAWDGIARREMVIYELHVGTFTEQGTFAAVIPRLGELRELGITAIEIMPVAQFPGDRNWGYDGVQPYAVQNSYGGPRELQRLANAAHRAGLAVILDVVYNHLGPEGNYLHEFGPYFTDRYRTPWGAAINLDGPDCDPVRRFVTDNACMWVRDFHVDGLRLDAVHAIYDFGANHILAELQESVQQAAEASGRCVHVIAESDQNDRRLVAPPPRGGYGLDAVWSDDFHHCVHTLTTDQRDGYFMDFGRPEHLAKALESVFVYDGCYSPFRRRHFGSSVEDVDRARFVVCVKNHDQIGNRPMGDRPATFLSPAAQRLTCGLLLLSPCVPLIFMGEEYGESRPFPFFCSFQDESLIEAVRKGRRSEFEGLQFEWGDDIPDPQSPETFAAAKLSWDWPRATRQLGLRRLYQTLLRARQSWPALRDRRRATARVVWGERPGATGQPDPLLRLQRCGEPPLVAWANLGPRPVPLEHGEPQHVPLLSTEDSRFGGERQPAAAVETLHPFELAIFGIGEDQ